jgi:hypothetical protein
LVLAVALVQVALVVLASGTALSRPAAPTPGWMLLLNVLLYGVCGALLLFGGRQDRRLQSLGAVFVTIASAFAHPLLLRINGPGWLYATLPHVCTDAFFATALWWFAWTFPRAPRGRVTRGIGLCFLTLAATIGATLVVVNLLDASPSWGANPLPARVVRALDRPPASTWYWLLTFGVAIFALPYLWWKSRLETREEYRRVRFFFLALIVGMGPFLVAVLTSILIPALGRPPWRDFVGIVLYSALASTVPTTAYAVLVERVMEIRLAIARTRQRQIVRYCVWLAGLAPLGYLAIDLHLHRDVTLAAYLANGRGIGLFVLLFVGFSALTFRYQVLLSVDKWFRADREDHADSLARLARSLRSTRTIRETTSTLALEIERAIHPVSAAVLIANEEADELVPLAGTAPPLSAKSVLADFVQSAGPDLRVRFAANSPLLSLLPPGDRTWLEESGVHLMTPLLGSTGVLLGVVALGEARHGLPYSDRDHALITSMCAQVALRLENQWLRERPSQEGTALQHPERRTVDWRNEPAECCPRCSRVWPAATKSCPCGSPVETAALPLVTAGKFQLERRLGSGGMGVVYLATDLALGRRVALDCSAKPEPWPRCCIPTWLSFTAPSSGGEVQFSLWNTSRVGRCWTRSAGARSP